MAGEFRTKYSDSSDFQTTPSPVSETEFSIFSTVEAHARHADSLEKVYEDVISLSQFEPGGFTTVSRGSGPIRPSAISLGAGFLG